MNLIWEYLNKVAEDAGIECRSKDPAHCRVHGHKDITYVFDVWGVNSVKEEVPTTAPSFMKAINNARYHGANEITRLMKNVNVQLKSCNGQPCKKNVIIYGDEDLQSPRIRGLDIGIQRHFDGQGTAGHDAGGGSGANGHQDRDVESHRARVAGIPVPVPPKPRVGRHERVSDVGNNPGVVKQGTFQFDEAKGKIRKYLSACAEDEMLNHPKNETLAEHREHCDAEPGNCPFEKKLDKTDDLTKKAKPDKTPEQLDAEYMEAVKRGDMETCSKMVREAAARAMPDTKVVDEDGLPLVMYHGSESSSVKTFNGGFYGGTYFTTIKEDAKERAGFYKDGYVYTAFVDIKNPVTINNWESSGVDGINELYDYTDLRGKPLIDNGYDGAIINFRSGHKDIFSVYPYQIKSADPVTYDDAGNVIPLSKRFNMTSADIRDEATGKIAKYLKSCAEDAWVDSGTGNMAWKWVKPKRRTPFDRLPKKRIHEIIGENVSLIKTIDEDLLGDVASKVYWLLAGRLNPDRFIDWLVDECNVSEARAYLIATDQVRKAKERMKVEDWKNRGIKFAVWRHKVNEEDPRDYHLRKWDGRSGIRNGKPNGLDGFVFKLEKPPVIDLKTGERGFPSQLIGCKCYITGVKGG